MSWGWIILGVGIVALVFACWFFWEAIFSHPWIR